MRVQVLVRLKKGVLDVQGKAVEHSLADLGFEDIGDVRIGKLVELDVETKDFEDAKKQAEQICKKLLVNAIIEDFEIREAA